MAVQSISVSHYVTTARKSRLCQVPASAATAPPMGGDRAGAAPLVGFASWLKDTVVDTTYHRRPELTSLKFRTTTSHPLFRSPLLAHPSLAGDLRLLRPACRACLRLCSHTFRFLSLHFELAHFPISPSASVIPPPSSSLRLPSLPLSIATPRSIAPAGLPTLCLCFRPLSPDSNNRRQLQQWRRCEDRVATAWPRRVPSAGRRKTSRPKARSRQSASKRARLRTFWTP